MALLDEGIGEEGSGDGTKWGEVESI